MCFKDTFLDLSIKNQLRCSVSTFHDMSPVALILTECNPEWVSFVVLCSSDNLTGMNSYLSSGSLG